MADHDLTAPEPVGGGDFLVMDDIGHTHDRPNDRRLIYRRASRGILLIEQMETKSGGWHDLGTVASIKGDVDIDDDRTNIGFRLDVKSGPQAEARDG